MTTKTFEIDAAAPIALLDVDNVLDNRFYSWCADVVIDENGDFVEDEDLTYDEFELGPEYILPAGTKVVMSHLWGWSDDGPTIPTNFVIVLPKAAPVQHVVHVIMSQYYFQLEAENAGGRFHFIEDVKTAEDGVVVITWGT